MAVNKTRSAIVWITADCDDYDIFLGHKAPAPHMLTPTFYNPEYSVCKIGFRKLFGGLGLRAHAKPKQSRITFEEVD